MSNGAKGDPEAIREFARRLSEFCESTQESLSGLQGHLNEMGNSTWSDSVYQDYLASFEEVASQITSIIDRVHPAHAEQLVQLAEKLEDYLGSR